MGAKDERERERGGLFLREGQRHVTSHHHNSIIHHIVSTVSSSYIAQCLHHKATSSPFHLSNAKIIVEKCHMTLSFRDATSRKYFLFIIINLIIMFSLVIQEIL